MIKQDMYYIICLGIALSGLFVSVWTCYNYKQKAEFYDELHQILPRNVTDILYDGKRVAHYIGYEDLPKPPNGYFWRIKVQNETTLIFILIEDVGG